VVKQLTYTRLKVKWNETDMKSIVCAGRAIDSYHSLVCAAHFLASLTQVSKVEEELELIGPVLTFRHP
jgi:hypothetical protein